MIVRHRTHYEDVLGALVVMEVKKMALVEFYTEFWLLFVVERKDTVGWHVFSVLTLTETAFLCILNKLL